MKLLINCILLQIIILITGADVQAADNPYELSLRRLDRARIEKVNLLSNFTSRIHNLAREAASDETVVKFFEINHSFFRIPDEIPGRDSVMSVISRLRKNFDYYYIENYFAFYDILFIDTSGTVFYSLRKEDDLNRNFLEDSSVDVQLAGCINKKPKHERFVDFHDYHPSREPAAFFVEPIFIKGKLAGWIALQCAINKVNSLFSSTDNLGQTGETFLVNEKGYMLTESYFLGNSTILKMHLDDNNVKMKFSNGEGQCTIIDYRGMTALSSYEVFDFLGTRWLVVAKVDKDEITTLHYQEHNRYFAKALCRYLLQAPTASLRVSNIPERSSAIRVDMDEFLKAENEERLETWGISTCTGLIAAIPGRCAYLAHISSHDKVYGGKVTNLLGQILKKIKAFDMRPCEMGRALFVVVAPHLESLPAIINEILSEGFMLKQIGVLYNPDAESSAIVYDYAENMLAVSWELGQSRNHCCVHNLKDALNVSRIVEDIMSSPQSTLEVSDVD